MSSICGSLFNSVALSGPYSILKDHRKIIAVSDDSNKHFKN
jgi:hypothetical protein